MTAAQPTVATAVAPRPRSAGRIIPKRWYVHVFLWAACIIIGFPLFYAILVSTQTNAQVYSYQFTPGSAFAANWNVAMNLNNLSHYLVNSVFVSLAVTFGKVVFALLAGLAFVYFRFPAKWAVFGFVLLTLMMPTEILVIALVRIVYGMGFSNTYGALIVPFLASATGVFLFRQHFMSIPPELSEAAQLDGANPLRFLWSVLIPMSWNTIAALAVIQFIYVWNMYLWPVLIIQGSEKQVIQVGLRTLQSSGQAQSWGPMMVGAVVASIPPLIVFILLEKQFMSGFALGREK